eukprot:gnl/TRDRNA2_/TRDRNA2_28492_c0_seq2.p1 gnl/TRDRNA2_/TRDRNA2_28492_c0~~gnl/TRDRNA2_/TRDRNA2_28492_c0_seq2.p1  ORF type:complete len:233 (-),score=16.72 gnl/TRDRNA2_/TRDRNA2_28492_c0_seq2:151-849(-)
MPSDAESAVQVDAWARVLSSSLVLAVAAPLTILTCWGAFGLGIAPAIVGVIAIVAALLVCCCQKAGCSRTCADPCCCRLCPDCADFIGAWHLRNVLFVIAVLSPIFCLPTFIAGVVFTALPTDCSVDCQPRNDLTIDDCRRCWNLDWARHEYPWSLMDQCWSAQVDVWRRETSTAVESWAWTGAKSSAAVLEAELKCTAFILRFSVSLPSSAAQRHCVFLVRVSGGFLLRMP